MTCYLEKGNLISVIEQSLHIGTTGGLPRVRSTHSNNKKCVGYPGGLITLHDPRIISTLGKKVTFKRQCHASQANETVSFSVES